MDRPPTPAEEGLPAEDSPSRWGGCPLEEHYFPDRKHQRKARKEASLADRSKFKKTDQNQRKKAQLSQELPQVDVPDTLQGRVVAIYGPEVWVEREGRQIPCSLRGVLKKERGELRNLVAVGDFVLFSLQGEQGVVEKILPRTSTLLRTEHFKGRKQQLIAVNIDQVLITLSVVQPPLKPFLIDRYLIAARKGKMEGVVIINKIDLLQEDEVEEKFYEEVLVAYRRVGIEILAVSVHTREGIEALQEIMKGKASVFSGQSGVGKSSLINCMTGKNLSTHEVMRTTNKGAHTTSVATLIPLQTGGWCIDTPGIKSFGMWELKKEEVREHFHEIKAIAPQCHYPACSHSHEPGCAVQQAAEEGKISLLRLVSYQRLIAEATNL